VTTADEITTLEAAAARHVLAVQDSPLVNGKARPFLEEVAHYCLEHDFADALARAAAQHRLDQPAQVTALHRLLVDNGVVVEHHGSTRFVPDGVGHYLAAYRLFRRQPNGPTLLHPLRKFLRPRTWRHGEEALFLVALWWPKAEKAMRRRLTVLLSPKHSDPHVHFVAALLHRRLVTADDLREKTIEVLHGHLVDTGREVGAWRATVGTLELLEPGQVADALERLARSRTRTASSRRRLDAVEELTERDPVRGEENLRLLAETLTGDRHERLEVAGVIGQRDAELGDRALRCLAAAPDMGDLRLEAARRTGDTALWADMIGGERELSDAGRLRHLAELAGVDPAEAVRTAERFAGTASDEETPVAIARAIRELDPEAALRIVDGVAWPTRRKVSDPVRLAAVLLIGELVPTRRFPDLARLSREAEGEETQLKAALCIVDQGGTVAALRDFAANPKKGRERRLLAARRVGKNDRDCGGRLLVDIATSGKAADSDQVKLLLEAHELAPSPAEEALETIVRDERRPGPFRIHVVESGVFGKAKAIELYEVIATTTPDRKALVRAARKVLGMNRDAGEQLMARLAEKFAADPEFQLSLLREAGKRGKAALRQLGLRSSSMDHRVKVATVLLGIDQKLAAEVIDKIVRTRRAGEVRIEAACLLPAGKALVALLHIVGDQDDQDVRFEAGRKAMEIDEERGKQALRTLAEDRRVSTHKRAEIRRVLDR
jgi:hypothetical protein